MFGVLIRVDCIVRDKTWAQLSNHIMCSESTFCLVLVAVLPNRGRGVDVEASHTTLIKCTPYNCIFLENTKA